MFEVHTTRLKDLQTLQKNSIDLNYICWVAIKKVTKLDIKDIFTHFPEYFLIKIIKNVFRTLLTIYYEFSSNQKQKKRRKKTPPKKFDRVLNLSHVFLWFIIA